MPWEYRHRALSGMLYLQVAALVLAVWLAPWLTRCVDRWLPSVANADRPLWRDLSAAVIRGTAAGLMLVLCLLFFRSQSAFIYFQF